jgi:hypothetical protein
MKNSKKSIFLTIIVGLFAVIVSVTIGYNIPSLLLSIVKALIQVRININNLTDLFIIQLHFSAMSFLALLSGYIIARVFHLHKITSVIIYTASLFGTFALSAIHILYIWFAYLMINRTIKTDFISLDTFRFSVWGFIGLFISVLLSIFVILKKGRDENLKYFSA